MRVILMALTWALVWAPVGLVVGTIVDPNESMDEPWLVVGLFPGFLCGAIFAIALGIAEGRRRLAELSLSRVAAWGASSGLVVGALPFMLGTANTALPLWQWLILIVGSITLLSSASALASALLARTRRTSS